MFGLLIKIIDARHQESVLDNFWSKSGAKLNQDMVLSQRRSFVCKKLMAPLS